MELITGRQILRGSVGTDAGRIRINAKGGEEGGRARLLLSQETFISLSNQEQNLVLAFVEASEGEYTEGPNGLSVPAPCPLVWRVECMGEVSSFTAKDGSEKGFVTYAPAPGELRVEEGSPLSLLKKWQAPKP